MARPSILGNHPPTEAEVNHALECCKAIPHIREELLAMEQDMFTERQNDEYPYRELASQADFDRF